MQATKTNLEHNTDILPFPWFVTGVSDGESSFSVTIYKDSKRKTGWRITPSFSIELHGKDIILLQKIKSFFQDVGKINIRQSNGQGIYFVRSYEVLTNIIIPNFDKYFLLTQKRSDFLLFKSIIELMNNGEHLTDERMRKIVSLRASMNKGLSEELMESFPNIIPVGRPLVEVPQTLDGRRYYMSYPLVSRLPRF